MPTFLTHARMSPELARRIERSLARPSRASPSGRMRVYSRGQGSPAMRMLLMLAVGVVAALAWLSTRGREHDLARRRTALHEAVASDKAALSARQLTLVSRAERWIRDVAAPTYPGDALAPELGLLSDLDAWLARPLVYLRGDRGLLARREAIAMAASTSDKDALVLCLVEPPPLDAAADVIEQVRGVYLRGALVDERTRNIRRLHDAAEGLRVLAAPWGERVRAAQTSAELQVLEQDLAHARGLEVGLAAGADGLLLVVDEGPSIARVALVDLTADKLLLRVRRTIPPDDASANARALYGASIDDCRLALETRAAVSDGVAPAR